MIVNFKLGENAKMPTQENSRDAGYDVYAAVEGVIPALGRSKIDTNLSWEMYLEDRERTYWSHLNLGVYIDVRDRSGNSLKKGLLKMAGVVDEQYRGNIGIVLFNTTNEPIKIEIGDKIAQIIFSPCFHPSRIEQVNELSTSSRGELGFGSSGVAGNVVQ